MVYSTVRQRLCQPHVPPVGLRAAIGSIVAAAGLVAGSAAAFPPPAGVGLDDQADLDQALQDGALTEERHEALLDRLRLPVDANTADREELYELPGVTWAMADAILAARAAAGRFAGVEDLATVPGLPRDVYFLILPYLALPTDESPPPWSVETSVAGTWRTGVEHPDHRLPGLALSARTQFLRHGSAGFLVTVRSRIGPVHDAAPGESLSAAGPALRVDPGAFWIAWDGPRWSVIGGAFRLGFGQGLTLGDGRPTRPRGWSIADDVTWSLRDGAVAPRKSHHGIALRVKRIDLPRGSLDLTVFGSARLRDLPAGDVVYDRCPPGQPDCPDSLRVPFLVDDCAVVDPATGAVGVRSLACSQPTLPFAMWDVLGGANLAWRHDARTGVGVTGYGEWLRLVPHAAGLRLGPSSPYPEGRMAFGAVGLDIRFGCGPFDMAGEATVTDRASPAAVLTGRLTPSPGLEILPSIRWFSTGFDNPWARPEADADEVLGNRARDELGGRLQIDYRPHPMVHLHTDVDVAHHRRRPTVTAGRFRAATDLHSLLTLQVLPTDHETLAVTVTYDDRDLARAGRRLSYAPYLSADGDLSGGAKVAWTLSGGTTRIPRTSVSFQVRQAFEDIAALPTRFDQTWSAWLRIATDLSPGPTLSLRVNVLDQSTVAAPDRAPGQICDFEDRGTELPARLPAACRGETRIQATLVGSRAFRLAPGRRVTLRLAGMWTRWLDHRGLWRYGAPCDPRPSRDQAAIQGSISVRF
jgi:hypothetical protein